MVIILIRGLSNCRFWKMKTRRASGRQDISVDWYQMDGGGERQKEAHSADSDKREGSNYFHFPPLAALRPRQCPISHWESHPFPVSSLPLLSQGSSLAASLPICDWNREKGVAPCLRVQTCLCWDPWVGFVFVYFMPLLGPPWALVTTCEGLKSFRKVQGAGKPHATILQDTFQLSARRGAPSGLEIGFFQPCLFEGKIWPNGILKSTVLFKRFFNFYCQFTIIL